MRRLDLVTDCSRCVALCCAAASFEASEDFAIDKPAGVACVHLTPEHRCSIHEQLMQRGFRGCAVYECYGAGPRVTGLFAGSPDDRQRHAAFMALRVVHELLWLLTEARKLCPPASTTDDLGARLVLQIEALDALAHGPAGSLGALDLEPHRDASNALLRRVGDALGGRRRRRGLAVVGSAHRDAKVDACRSARTEA